MHKTGNCANADKEQNAVNEGFIEALVSNSNQLSHIVSATNQFNGETPITHLDESSKPGDHNYIPGVSPGELNFIATINSSAFYYGTESDIQFCTNHEAVEKLNHNAPEHHQINWGITEPSILFGETELTAPCFTDIEMFEALPDSEDLSLITISCQYSSEP